MVSNLYAPKVDFTGVESDITAVANSISNLPGLNAPIDQTIQIRYDSNVLATLLVIDGPAYVAVSGYYDETATTPALVRVYDGEVIDDHMVRECNVTPGSCFSLITFMYPIKRTFRLRVQTEAGKTISLFTAFQKGSSSASEQTTNVATGARIRESLANSYQSIVSSVDARGGSSGIEIRSLIRFDLSSFPTDRVAENAVVRLRFIGGHAGTHAHEMYAMISDWNVDEATWNDKDVADPWSTPGVEIGAECDASPFDVRNINSPDDDGEFITWDCTTLYNAWVTGARQNRGVMLRRLTGGATTSAFNGTSTSTVGHRPNLIVTLA